MENSNGAKYRIEKVINTRNNVAEFFPQVYRNNSWWYLIADEFGSLRQSQSPIGSKCDTEGVAKIRIEKWKEMESQFGSFSSKITEYIYLN